MSVMDFSTDNAPITRGCIVEVIAGKDFGLRGEVISINKLAGADYPRELFVIREGGNELIEEDYLVPYENEVEILLTAAQRDWLVKNNSLAHFYGNRGREI